ncbi:hypothetical protein [Flavobacterium sp.]|uniref:hypothetical protein n=1 Tax=Flavobacterium sp. TaxID=239 RepID=UPI003919C14E
MKVNKPTWRNGNVVGAFYNGMLWNNNIFQIHVAIYNKNKIINEETFEAAIEFKFNDNLKLIASLKTRNALLKSEEKILDRFSIDYQILDDGNSFIMLKISFDISSNEAEIKTGNHYFIILFENNKTLVSTLNESGIVIEKI